MLRRHDDCPLACHLIISFWLFYFFSREVIFKRRAFTNREKFTIKAQPAKILIRKLSEGLISLRMTMRMIFKIIFIFSDFFITQI